MLPPSQSLRRFQRLQELRPEHSVGGGNQAFVRTVQIRDHGGYFRNKLGALSVAFGHGRHQPWSVRHPLITMLVVVDLESWSW